jgi:hypothetical protein
MKLGIIIFLTAIILVSCSDNKSTIPQTHNAENQDFIVNVMTFESESALNKYIEENNLETRQVQGLARWLITTESKVVKRCDIYVVKPKSSRDNSTFTTWGHELVHCIYGSFHKD